MHVLRIFGTFSSARLSTYFPETDPAVSLPLLLLLDAFIYPTVVTSMEGSDILWRAMLGPNVTLKLLLVEF